MSVAGLITAHHTTKTKLWSKNLLIEDSCHLVPDEEQIFAGPA